MFHIVCVCLVRNKILVGRICVKLSSKGVCILFDMNDTRDMLASSVSLAFPLLLAFFLLCTEVELQRF